MLTKSPSLLIFCSLLGLVFSHVIPKEPPHDNCTDIGPEVHCASYTEAIRCNKIEFCLIYLSKSICEREPEAYCKTKEIARKCKKEAYCLTWPDDGVTAIKVTTEKSIFDFFTDTLATSKKTEPIAYDDKWGSAIFSMSRFG